ncbi:MAG: hypothetical protein AB1637_05130 [Elusimicrobiota bacterium]
MAENKRYWAYIRKNILGPFSASKISEIPGFGPHTLVSPENALGQWRECSLEDDFSIYLQIKEASQSGEVQAVKKALTENSAFRNILEQSLAKNKYFEKEIEKLAQSHEESKKNFENALKEKEETIKNLKAALEEEKKKNSDIQKAPQWERLYAELKLSSERKSNSFKNEKEKYLNEIESLKNRIQSAVNAYEAYKNKINEKHLSEKIFLENEIAKLKNASEEKETAIASLKETIKTLVAKNNELHKILNEEKEEKEKKERAFTEEAANLKTELSFLKSENAKLKEKISALNEIVENFEKEGFQKEKEQEEIFKIIHSKIRLLNSYFSGIESRLKKAEE